MHAARCTLRSALRCIVGRKVEEIDYRAVVNSADSVADKSQLVRASKV